MTNAIKKVFPENEHKLCYLHLKDNINHYLSDNEGVSKSTRDRLVGALFNSDGILYEDDDHLYETRLAVYRGQIAALKNYSAYFEVL